VEDWWVEDNTNINMLEETKENYLQSSKYAKAQMNVLDEVLTTIIFTSRKSIVGSNKGHNRNMRS
jgi:hypothetical protein